MQTPYSNHKMLSVNILDMKFQRNKMRGKCLAWKRTSKQAWAEIGQAQVRFEFELRLKLGDEWVDKYKIIVKSTQVEVVVEVWVELGNLSPFSDLFPLKIVQIQMFLELLWKIVVVFCTLYRFWRVQEGEICFWLIWFLNWFCINP